VETALRKVGACRPCGRCVGWWSSRPSGRGKVLTRQWRWLRRRCGRRWLRLG
jgi:hypothetical protein